MPEINCIALIGTHLDGVPGFAVRVGGGLSTAPRIARDLGVFTPSTGRSTCCERSWTSGAVTAATACPASRHA
jgi:sulfite reductase beta subunit-like hemoprotein